MGTEPEALLPVAMTICLCMQVAGASREVTAGSAQLSVAGCRPAIQLQLLPWLSQAEPYAFGSTEPLGQLRELYGL